jgi:hypothetical protein
MIAEKPVLSFPMTEPVFDHTEPFVLSLPPAQLSDQTADFILIIRMYMVKSLFTAHRPQLFLGIACSAETGRAQIIKCPALQIKAIKDFAGVPENLLDAILQFFAGTGGCAGTGIASQINHGADQCGTGHKRPQRNILQGQAAVGIKRGKK